MFANILRTFLLVLIVHHTTVAQDLFFPKAEKESRKAEVQVLQERYIQPYVSGGKTLSDDKVISALYAIKLLQLHTPDVKARLMEDCRQFANHSEDYNIALLEAINNLLPDTLHNEVAAYALQTTDYKAFAIAMHYVLKSGHKASLSALGVRLQSLLQNDPKNALLQETMFYFLSTTENKSLAIDLRPFFHKDYLKGKVIVYSLQRKNRNYPGLVIVRDSSGKFVSDSNGIITIGQLARSLSNMPYFISNGNTPQGIFSMQGYAVSKSEAIGPTTNLQMNMPFEASAARFFKDTTLKSKPWTEDMYKALLPQALQQNREVWGTFIAGKIGRSEIIAHGTTVDPAYYFDQPYFPFTPTAGCLATEEWWSAKDGRRMISYQQKLINTIQQAGGTNGYFIVLEINDEHRRVSIEDILPLLP